MNKEWGYPAASAPGYPCSQFCAAKETAKPVRIRACVLYTTSLHSIELSQALRSSGIIGVSGKPDEDLESRFSSCARAICVFTFLSTAPAVALQRAKPRKTPFIRHVYIPAFMILTNPPSRSTVQDDVLRGVPLQEMLPRKGIATTFPISFPPLPRGFVLQEMLPRKGIATASLCTPGRVPWSLVGRDASPG